jgi:hypothetical protein
MRFVIPLLLSVVFAAGTAAAQPASSGASGNMPLSPNNCGTPYEPKPCPGMMRGHHAPAHKAPTTSKAPAKQ